MVERRSTSLVIKKPRKKSDELLKGAFKENFPDFLRFVYPDADDLIDFGKEIVFMDTGCL